MAQKGLEVSQIAPANQIFDYMFSLIFNQDCAYSHVTIIQTTVTDY